MTAARTSNLKTSNLKTSNLKTSNLKTSNLKKSDLPTKACATCGRPFAWRRKWARVWDEVRYCSDRCRAGRGQPHATRALLKPGGGRMDG